MTTPSLCVAAQNHGINTDTGELRHPGTHFACVADVQPRGGASFVEPVAGDRLAVLIESGDTVEIRVACDVEKPELEEDGRTQRAGATTETLLATSRQRLDSLALRGWDTLRDDHVADHRRLFRRCNVAFAHGGDGLALRTLRPTRLRLEEWDRSEPDADLIALIFQYGRYLLISSSRPGSLPANLQGALESSFRSAVECGLSLEHQSADELLAGGGHRSGGMRRTARHVDSIDDSVRAPACAFAGKGRRGIRTHVRCVGVGGAHRPAGLGYVAAWRKLARIATVRVMADSP